ncbi:chorismate synthase [uncultured Campylobacter sp.]|uniref:chorismate synthase n=1 Tax=uncultured Campylobacter sp. TaxID=218934 RepID=UPI00261B6F6A|nr:chorismate synthase [uncultured Campylobacter sp.]
MNTFGSKFRFTSFGESHGKALGCIVDGVPAGIKFDYDFLQNELDKRKPGQNKFSTQRKESDKAEVLSGVFEGYTTGTPIAIVIFNENQHSKDYENIKNIFRPSHADFTYFHKYGIRDYRGGGRASARETVARVAAGAVAAMLLKEFDIEIHSGILGIGSVVSKLESKDFDFSFAQESEIFCLDRNIEDKLKDEILNARNAKDSVGAVVFSRITNSPIGLGEPLYDKLDSKISYALMGINAVKAVEIGSGIRSSKMKASEANDALSEKGFLSNNAGGILGGISNGEFIEIKTHFKPTPSIFLEQDSIDINGKNTKCLIKGRHDPCVGVRGAVVCTAMLRLVMADSLLLNLSSNLAMIKKAYKK